MKIHEGPELQANPLLVSDYDGNPGSGKSTIIAHLKEVLPQIPSLPMPNVVTEATGIYYRAVALQFLREGFLQPDDSEDDVQKIAGWVSLKETGDIIDCGQDILLARYGADNLKSPEVNSIVSYLPRVEVIRSGIRRGFQDRLRHLSALPEGDPERPSLVLADGRNLRPLVRGVTGAKLLLSHFITCSTAVTATREYRRRELRGETVSVEEAKRIIENIQKRNYADAANPHNPGSLDNDALVFAPTTDEVPNNNVMLRLGIKAALTDKQVHYDTTNLSEPNMLKAAQLLIEGAWLGLDTSKRLSSSD